MENAKKKARGCSLKKNSEALNMECYQRKIIFKMPFLGDMLVPWRVFFGVERHYPIVLKFRYEFLELCVRSLTHTSLQLFAADLLEFSEIRQDKESSTFMLGFNWIYIYI